MTEEKPKELLLCEVCGSLVLQELAVKVNVTLGESVSQIVICHNCIRRELEAPEKYIKKQFKGELSQAEALQCISNDLFQIRALLFKPRKFSLKRGQDVEEIRSQAIDKILDAMIIVEGLAKKAPTDTEKGKADTTKARYYHLLGYLVQVLDGILRSAKSGELDVRLKAAEGIINEFKKREDKKARGGS